MLGLSAVCMNCQALRVVNGAVFFFLFTDVIYIVEKKSFDHHWSTMGGNLSCTSTKRGLKDPDLQPYGIKETEGDLDIKTGKAVSNVCHFGGSDTFLCKQMYLYL